MSWTTADVPDLAGRLAVVTGANSGVGLETARALARAGADVIVATRSESKGLAAITQLAKEAPAGHLRHESLDLADLASVSSFADRLQETGRPVDLLINNAGIMSLPERRTSVDGWELQLATNHFGHFALTARLLDLLRATPGARVVTVTSLAARLRAAIRFDDLQLERGYTPWRAYAQSKLATLLFALELGRRSRAGAWGVLSVAAHPGSSHTNLQTTGPRDGRSGRGWDFNRIFMSIPGLAQSAAAGALPTLRAATEPGSDLKPFYGPARHLGLVGPPVAIPVPRQAQDPAVAARLWEVSAQLTGSAWPEVAA